MALYDNDGYVIIPGITPQPAPLIVQNCNRIELECSDRNYWIDAFRVVDARPGTMWPVGGPKRDDMITFDAVTDFFAVVRVKTKERNGVFVHTVHFPANNHVLVMDALSEKINLILRENEVNYRRLERRTKAYRRRYERRRK